MKKLTELDEWRALAAHYHEIAPCHMLDWFRKDPERFSHFSLQVHEILLDYSKNRITSETLELLCQLAKATDLATQIESLFTGENINPTEKRPALHTALRDTHTRSLLVNGQNIMPAIRNTLDKMNVFTTRVRAGEWKGYTGKPIQHIINIGIGGSHLGPLMTTDALKELAHPQLHCHYLSDIDNTHLKEILNRIDPETSLFIVSSKSFTTLETLTNAQSVRTWLQKQLGTSDLQAHFIAVTAEPERAIEFGISPEHIFPIWHWVGGRYSIWSAIGLPLALMIGMDHFIAFLEGAHEMDQHFRHADFSENMPVILGLLGIWYINFFGVKSLAIAPYAHDLHHLRAYLQQLDMESNGKSISKQGTQIDVATGPVIIGEQGCHGQHAYHQLLHQGPEFIPVDFILVGNTQEDIFKHHTDILISSGLSQAQALLQGKSYAQALNELLKKGYAKTEAEQLAKHQVIPGNRPSQILFLNRLTPRNLGALIALYEHKIFVQGVIWGINSFDQWGVELGKALLPFILSDLTSHSVSAQPDSSTVGLIKHYKALRGSHD